MAADIPLNARHLLEEHRAATNAPAPFALEPAAEAWLKVQDWPGNYAQLSRVLVAAAHPKIDVAALETSLRRDEEILAKTRTQPRSVSLSAETPTRTRRTNSPFPVAPEVAKAVAPAPAATTFDPVPDNLIVSPARTGGNDSPRATPAERAPDHATVLGTRSLFRPPTGAYDFHKRLATSLAAANASAAS
jgi:hypothetical protein